MEKWRDEVCIQNLDPRMDTLGTFGWPTYNTIPIETTKECIEQVLLRASTTLDRPLKKPVSLLQMIMLIIQNDIQQKWWVE